MWPSWKKSPRHDSASTSPPFKDALSAFPDDHSHSTAPKRNTVFHRVYAATAVIRSWRSPPLRHGDKRIVVYLTSLRVVRKTFEDCRAVTSILRGFRVAVDERDLSMDSGFLAELEEILGRQELSLPRVFIGGRYIGGADEIRRLHETGELQKYIEGVPLAEPGVCSSCGGVRFVLCPDCDGSHKHHCEKGGMRSCPSCNENGLARCPQCGFFDAS